MRRAKKQSEPSPEEAAKAIEPGRSISRPKILLLDLPDGTTERLSAKGFNVVEGTFGRPYATAVGDNYVPVVEEALLPDLNEQEIIVVDLTPLVASQTAPREKETSLGTLDIWARASRGLIDPRPSVMRHVQDRCDRILHHGGVFIVFVEPRRDPGYVLGQASRRYGFEKRGAVEVTNWGFLSVLASESDVQVAVDHGLEMQPEESAEDLLGHHLKGAHFTATLSRGYSFASKLWLPLAKNKYDETVAAVLFDSSEPGSGAVFLLPHVPDKAALLLDFLDGLLPRVFPHLFPDSDELGWVHDPNYELPRVVEIGHEIARTEKEHEVTITALREEAAIEQATEGWQYDLLRGTGEKLVDAVRQALAALGFAKVEDVDATLDKGTPRREDLRVRDREPLLLVEVKGVTGTGKEAGALQVMKYVAPRMREFGHTEIQGLSVVNHQRNLAPRDRQAQPFQKDLLVNAEEQKFGIITGVDLFRLVRNMRRLGWRHEDVGDVLYRTGRIEPVPTHYEFIGTVDGYWERVPALGIRVEHGAIRPGDTVAFEMPIDFVEEQVTSIQIEGSHVAEATIGQHVAVGTTLTKKEARNGIRVFRATKPA